MQRISEPNSSSIAIRTSHRLLPDPTRVLIKIFVAGQEDFGSTESRINVVVQRVLALSDDEVGTALAIVTKDFSHRHDDFDALLHAHAQRACECIVSDHELTNDRWKLLGACFTHEFSVEGAALCNPSAVLHPDQSGLGAGMARFIMTVRAIGEGHRSSIGFRTGVIDQWGGISVDAPQPRLHPGAYSDPLFTRQNFIGPLESLSDFGENAQTVLSKLPDEFTLEQLEERLIVLLHSHDTHRNAAETVLNFRTIAERSYVVDFPKDSSYSERVLWPHASSEWRGMEDARLVRFAEDDGSTSYLATYTAFDGSSITQQMFRTTDFQRFEMFPVSGRAARGKGLAVFPRKVGGAYMALTRMDHESNFISTSDQVEHWDDATAVQVPSRPWELIQLGNCGSPIETEAGWLVVTHAVGPFRTYYLSAMLLDLNDPMRVVGTLNQPLLAPIPAEREGYVPNVVYSCGSLKHRDVLMIPFGIADNSIGFATARITDLLTLLTDTH